MGVFVVELYRIWSRFNSIRSSNIRAAAAGGEDALGRCPDFGGVGEPAEMDAELQRPELDFCGSDDLGCAGGVTAGAAVGVDHHRAGSVIECLIGIVFSRRSGISTQTVCSSMAARPGAVWASLGAN